MEEIKAWFRKVIGREPTEQEMSEAPKMATPPTTPTTPTAPIAQALPNAIDAATLQSINELKAQNLLLIEKLNAQEAARAKAEEATMAKAEADRQAAIDAKVADAKAKGLIPPDNKDIEANWRSILSASFDNGVALLDAATPINAGTPPAGNGQQNTGAANAGTANSYDVIRQAAEAALAPK